MALKGTGLGLAGREERIPLRVARRGKRPGFPWGKILGRVPFDYSANFASPLGWVFLGKACTSVLKKKKRFPLGKFLEKHF